MMMIMLVFMMLVLDGVMDFVRVVLWLDLVLLVMDHMHFGRDMMGHLVLVTPSPFVVQESWRAQAELAGLKN